MIGEAATLCSWHDFDSIDGLAAENHAYDDDSRQNNVSELVQLVVESVREAFVFNVDDSSQVSHRVLIQAKRAHPPAEESSEEDSSKIIMAKTTASRSSPVEL